MEAGRRYRVQYRTPAMGDAKAGRIQEMVVDFLDRTGTEWVFSGRPAFGTVRLHDRDYEMVKAEEVSKETKIKRPQNLPLHRPRS